MKLLKKSFLVASAVACTATTMAFASNEPMCDRAITMAVVRPFDAHPDLGGNVSVRTIKGTVYISGIVWSGRSSWAP